MGIRDVFKKKLNREVCLNLYYVFDNEGIIYSLRVHSYVIDGTDEEKTTFLRERASMDYEIAKPFPVPERFHIQIGGRKIPVGHVSHLKLLDSPIALFEDAIRDVEKAFPAQSNLCVPDDPIVCITPLLGDDDGNIVPYFGGTESCEL